MNSATTCPSVRMPARRSAVQALVDRLRELADRHGVLLRGSRAVARRPLDLGSIAALDGLDDAMLRDIGFAAWQVEQRALRRSREVERWLW